MLDGSIEEWASDEMFSANFGDLRRRKRAVEMLSRMAAKPSGSVLHVFRTSAERQGAYDFLENDRISTAEVSAAICAATASRAAAHPFVFVPIDGTSLTLTDRQRAKDFGGVGSTARGARGLKLVHGYAVSPAGVPLGVTAQSWWARPIGLKRQDHKSRKLREKETRHWVDVIENSRKTLEEVAPRTRLWFQLDREADGAHVLAALQESGHWFTVRSNHDRRLIGAKKYLRARLRAAASSGEYTLAVLAGPARKARTARMVVRFAPVTLETRDRATGRTFPVTVNAVTARECGTTPRGESPIHWTLLTNHAVVTLADAQQVIDGYAQRWRIEELHRTWKSGACCVEDSQLRRRIHVIKWATLMVAVASRIERLKKLARGEPELAASVELTPFEIKALVLTRRRTKKRTDPDPVDQPTIGDAVRWLADIGGYTGPKVSGGPPGSITIQRGLDYITPIAAALEQLETEGKLR